MQNSLFIGSSVRVKTVAVYLRVSTPLAQRQASTPVGLGHQWLRKFDGLLWAQGHNNRGCRGVRTPRKVEWTPPDEGVHQKYYTK